VFESLTVHGGAGAVMHGYYEAVVVTSWRITRVKDEGGRWILRATIARIDKAQARRAPLLFTAPRPGGFWAWPVKTLALGETSLRAELGPPER
jgi:hypothetical protein